MEPNATTSATKARSPEDASPATAASPVSSSSPPSETARPTRPSASSPTKSGSGIPLSSKPKINPSTTTSQSSGSQQSPQVSPMLAGPLNSTYVVPPRPKPGRKPATDDPPSKRKAQNRDAQRAFRDRKKQRLDELELETAQMRQHMDELESEKALHLQQIDALRQDLQRSTEQVQTLEEKIEEMQQASKRDAESRRDSSSYFSVQHAQVPPVSGSMSWITTPTSASAAGTSLSKGTIGCGNCRDNGECPCVDEMVNFNAKSMPAEQPGLISPMSPDDTTNGAEAPAYEEIDFTAAFLKPETKASLAKAPSFTNILLDSQATEKCGFCFDESHCICKQADLQEQKRDRPTLPPPVRTQLSNGSAAVSSTETLPCFTGPGSCSECRANPEQRRFCETVSSAPRLSEEDFRGRRLNSIIARSTRRDGSVELRPPKRQQTTKFGSISEAYHRFKDRNIPLDQPGLEKKFVMKESALDGHTELELHALDALFDLGCKANRERSDSGGNKD